MLLFICILFFCLFVEFVRKLLPNKIINAICIIFIFLACSIMPAIKNITVGTDTNMYVNFFSMNMTYAEWWAIAGIEPGFAFCIKILQGVGLENYFYYFLFFSLLYNGLTISAIYKISSGKYLSLIIYLTCSSLYFLHFNVLRQSIALAFFIYSLTYLVNGKYLKSYLFILLATLFHFSAIILFAVPLIYKSLRKHPVFIIISSLFFLLLYSNASVLLSFVGDIIGTTKYAAYNKENNFGGGYFIFCALVFSIALYFLLKTKLKDNDKYIFFTYLLFMAFITWICMLVFGLKYDGPGRIINYFYVGILFVIPDWFKVLNEKYKPLLFLFIVLFSFAIFYYVFFISGLHAVFPYTINNYL
ncbi:EpsG family protein [Klebsiella pneumoniae]|nr:EpsG family protein [Klebsiella pneumoniae]